MAEVANNKPPRSWAGLLLRLIRAGYRSCTYLEKEGTMNWDQVEGNWKQVKGKVKEQWGRLTDDEIDKLNGKREQLVGKVQERYGYERDRAEREVDESIRRW
jgi:uncharacterized protein YjbJ (UPF0337 family)